jgi:hypothetical protein
MVQSSSDLEIARPKRDEAAPWYVGSMLDRHAGGQGTRGSVMRHARWFAALCLLALPSVSTAGEDPGLVIELDRGAYKGRVRDERSGEQGPEFSIALGSPARPTPDGQFPIAWVILQPSWHPSPGAWAAGARPEPSSLSTPMGVAKIPFTSGGSIALHGAGDERLLGQPVSGGCVRAADGDLLRMLAWLDLQGALGAPFERKDGEIHRPLRRPTRLIVH